MVRNGAFPRRGGKNRRPRGDDLDGGLLRQEFLLQPRPLLVTEHGREGTLARHPAGCQGRRPMRSSVQIDDVDAIRTTAGDPTQRRRPSVAVATAIAIATATRTSRSGTGPGKHMTPVHPEALPVALGGMPRIALRHRHVMDELRLAAGEAVVIVALRLALAKVVVVPRPRHGNLGFGEGTVQPIVRIVPAVVVRPPLGVDVRPPVVHIVAEPYEEIGPEGAHILPQHRRYLLLGLEARAVRDAGNDGVLRRVQMPGRR
mmetsp:Transcript_28727/g.83289  ORF Transcript_28727/g.83289 Transcript_28727/m.83289 type:complete len:259 (-) Transcript_28727:278-1054(-)